MVRMARTPICAAVVLLLAASSLTAAPALAATARCMGEPATIVGTSGDDTLIGSRGRDVIVSKGGADEIGGRGGPDLICAGGGDDFVSGDGGGDLLAGGIGSDILSGAGGSDLLEGGSGVDIMAGGNGNDRYSGGDDLDLATFLASPSPVVVDLGWGSADGEGSDELTGVEAVHGSDFDDTLYGDDSMNAFFGGPGSDTLDGGGSDDFVAYSLEAQGMQIDIDQGFATEGTEVDGLYSIENVLGTPFDDAISGDATANFLSGEEGDDIVSGGGGGDICYGESTNGCIEMLPTTSEPPGEVSGRVTMSSRAGDRLRSVAAPLSRADGASGKAASSGSVTCPMMTGTAVMTYPSWTGYGYWAWRYSYPWPAGQWNYGPWLYFDGSQWIAHFGGQWFNVANSAAWQGGHSTAIEAWYYHYDSGSWYEIGECFVQTTHLIPGLIITPG